MKRVIRGTLASGVLTVVGGAAGAQLMYEDLSILPPDGPGVWFGCALASDGTEAIVGACLDDDNGSHSGSASVYNTVTGAFVSKLLADDGDADDWFGTAVDISGSLAVVGVPYDDDFAFNAGAAYLFDTTTGSQLFRLIPENGASRDLFGQSVAICGGMAYALASEHRDGGFPTGAVYVFDTTTGQQVDVFHAPPQAARLSNGLATDDRVLYVAAREWDGSALKGVVYVLDRFDGTHLSTIRVVDDSWNSGFGTPIDADAGRVIVGARFDDVYANSSGSAYLFDLSDLANPVQIAKLIPDDGAAADEFGAAVAIGDGVAIVGAWNDTNENGLDAGSAYRFDISSGAQVAKLLASDGARDDGFGKAVTISDDFAFIGAPYKNHAMGSQAGVVYLFALSAQPCNDADLAEPFGVLDTLDVDVFVTAFLARQSEADLNGDTIHDLGDIGAFIDAFIAGCP